MNVSVSQLLFARAELQVKWTSLIGLNDPSARRQIDALNPALELLDVMIRDQRRADEVRAHRQHARSGGMR